MRYLALATDYDGTLAHGGRVKTSTLESLKRVRSSGRKLLLVTGRHLPDLIGVFPQLDLFNRVVADNGALLYDPATRAQKLLSEPPNARFVQLLRDRGIPIEVGRGVIASWRPYHQEVLRGIRDAGVDLQIILNKDAVMVLPSGVNKGTGLKAALEDLGISADNVVGIGDAENDDTFLAACRCSVAVANALDPLKEQADVVTASDNGSGVEELIGQLLDDDLARYESRLRRHGLGEAPVTPVG